MNKTTPLLYALLPLALVACRGGDDAGQQDPATGTAAAGMADGGVAATTDATAGDATASAAMDPTTGTAMASGDADHKALLAVQEVDRHEIAAAEDALSKNVEGEVRRYAETLRDEHTRNLEATTRLMGDDSGSAGTSAAMAHGAGGSDAELAAMRQKHEAERTRLAALEGEAFTTAWVDAMVKGHEEALAKLDSELIPGASDAGVSQHLRDTRAAIQRHLDTARSLQGGAGGM
ncbi:DUF4142 domain-containing protein [Luteimonas sp. MC1895]|uniref:DUF4142 domain-containing protein n=1 Tax=Luteimonas sp. MC1895 TaxID=2819513 RepID=UPI0018F092BB|nr:DUF4142 domain-containing protein [Luteimonas sp. MC1895]MBJ6979344.1 DUF4142 domain-containing protein [Luteimonas sp. MC1895]